MESMHFSIDSLETGPKMKVQRRTRDKAGSYIPPVSELLDISRAAVSKAHIPNAKMSIAGVNVMVSSTREVILLE